MAYIIILYVIFLGFVIKNSEETILYKPYIVTVVSNMPQELINAVIKKNKDSFLIFSISCPYMTII